MLQPVDDEIERRSELLVPSPLAVNSTCGSEPAEGASTSMSEYQYPPDLKFGIEELCPVCGDKVSGYHYGLQTCESCKGFFKRTVQNKKVYSCVDNRSCHIDKSQRKRCPFCRFQKCLSVGMKLEAVRTDRMRGGRNKFGPMYKRDRALKQQAMRQRQQLLAQCQLQVNGAMSQMDLNMDPSGLSMPQQLALHPHHTSPLYNSGLSGMPPGEMPDIKPNINMLTCMPAMLGQNMDSQNQMLGAFPGNNMLLQGNRHSSSAHLGNMNNVNLPQGMGHSHSQAPPGGGQLQPLKPLQPMPHSPNSDSENHITSNSISMATTSPSSQQQSAYLLPQHHHQHHHPSPNNHNNFPAGLISEINHLMNGNNNGVGGHYGNQNLPPPLTPTPNIVPSLIKSLEVNELNENEVQHKLAEIAEAQLLILQQQPEILQDHSKQWLQMACRLADQYLFLLVEWARSAIFFKELKVEDQMKLLQNCWSELIILDFIYKQRRNTSPDIFTLITGHKVSLDIINKLGLPDFKEHLRDLIRKFHELKMDHHEYTCLKFLILLNPDVQGVNNAGHLEQSQEKINMALQEYCTLFHTDLKDKVGQLLLRLPEIRMLSLHIEEYLYIRHTAGDIPEQTLLMELLHAKRK